MRGSSKSGALQKRKRKHRHLPGNSCRLCAVRRFRIARLRQGTSTHRATHSTTGASLVTDVFSCAFSLFHIPSKRRLAEQSAAWTAAFFSLLKLPFQTTYKATKRKSKSEASLEQHRLSLIFSPCSSSPDADAQPHTAHKVRESLSFESKKKKAVTSNTREHRKTSAVRRRAATFACECKQDVPSKQF